MLEFSRALYRQVGEHVEACNEAERARGAIVSAAEIAIARVADDPASVPRVARWLFKEIRHLFGLSHQAYARRAVDAVCAAAARDARRRSEQRLDYLGQPRRCPELTRRGTPCQREPLANGHCPSHQHLVEPPTATLAA